MSHESERKSMMEFQYSCRASVSSIEVRSSVREFQKRRIIPDSTGIDEVALGLIQAECEPDFTEVTQQCTDCNILREGVSFCVEIPDPDSDPKSTIQETVKEISLQNCPRIKSYMKESPSKEELETFFPGKPNNRYSNNNRATSE